MSSSLFGWVIFFRFISVKYKHKGWKATTGYVPRVAVEANIPNLLLTDCCPGRHGSDRLRNPPLPSKHQAGLLLEAEHGAGGIRADPSLRAVRGDFGDRQQGVHACGAERRLPVPDGVHAAHAHCGR